MTKKIVGGIVLCFILVGTLYMFARKDKSLTGSQSTRVYHVGILSGLDLFADSVIGFKEKMASLGYIEGKNITYDLQKTNFEPEKEEAIIKKFIKDEVDLIFVFPTEASIRAKAVVGGTGIPLVFGNSYVEGTDLIDTIAEPGKNITGVRFPGIDISVKRLEFLHEILPKAKRVWVTYAKDYPITPILMEKVRTAAKNLNITLVEVPASTVADVELDFAAREKKGALGIDAMLLISEPLGTTPPVFAAISKFADKHKLMIGNSIVTTNDTGPLFGYLPQSKETGQLAAITADKVFNGIPVGTIPVATPETYLKINSKVAKKLGIPLSESFLGRASEIIR